MKVIDDMTFKLKPPVKLPPVRLLDEEPPPDDYPDDPNAPGYDVNDQGEFIDEHGVPYPYGPDGEQILGEPYGGTGPSDVEPDTDPADADPTDIPGPTKANPSKPNAGSSTTPGATKTVTPASKPVKGKKIKSATSSYMQPDDLSQKAAAVKRGKPKPTHGVGKGVISGGAVSSLINAKKKAGI